MLHNPPNTKRSASNSPYPAVTYEFWKTRLAYERELPYCTPLLYIVHDRKGFYPNLATKNCFVGMFKRLNSLTWNNFKKCFQGTTLHNSTFDSTKSAYFTLTTKKISVFYDSGVASSQHSPSQSRSYR